MLQEHRLFADVGERALALVEDAGVPNELLLQVGAAGGLVGKNEFTRGAPLATDLIHPRDKPVGVVTRW